MDRDRVTVAAVQFDSHIFEAAYNMERIEELLEKAVQEHRAELVVFPEAAITGYCFKSKAEAHLAAIEREGEELVHLRELANKLDVSIVVGAVELDQDQIYNTVFFIEPDGTTFSYRKSHLPFLGLDRFVKAGDEPGAVFDTRFGKIGIIVCYELRFPETARAAALGGARLILQPTNLPQGGESHTEFLSRARACENRVHFVSCNRIGTERGFTFIGTSQIVDYNGTVLKQAGKEEEIISQTLELTPCEDKDIIGTPGERELYLFRHRRWDIYDVLSHEPDEKGFVLE